MTTPTVFVKPILYGNTAQHFGSKRDSDGHTHKWTLYVRPFNNEDMSAYVSRVQFRLHETYQNNNRVVHQAPFEIEESGWGEFDVQISVFFADANEKPVTFYHHLKLFSTEPDIVTGKKPFVNEYYDELVFQEPSALLASLLSCPKPLPPSADATQPVEKDYALEKTETRKRIRTARLRIRGEVQQLTERLRIAQGNLKRVRQRPVDNVVAPGTFRAITRENSTHDGSFL